MEIFFFFYKPAQEKCGRLTDRLLLLPITCRALSGALSNCDMTIVVDLDVNHKTNKQRQCLNMILMTGTLNLNPNHFHQSFEALSRLLESFANQVKLFYLFVVAGRWSGVSSACV